MKIYIKVHASKLSNANACLQSDLKLHRRPNIRNIETFSYDTTCNAHDPWDKAKGAKINTNLSLIKMDIITIKFTNNSPK